ncbi:ATP-binding cassette domain-containing protein [Histidinibacterium lentulum]|uniref:ABC transporter ATP-binding protein n=1 Tax=Histidinibacterium lentulum TaxID=2480588 RepID=A0A3N2QR92_9RHOB|nr:ABC transporter ATP-binding protein [Histidinibacterium lentulum]ROT97701.1 ABC transporter ATP-binding protein [Histidinibacterium lentulum]
MTEPVVSVRDLVADLGREAEATRVLGGVSFAVGAGEIVALVGESGSGKSTIGKALQGLLPQDAVRHLSGSVRIDGTEVIGADPRTLRDVRRRLVRAVPQNPMGALNPTMTIGRQLAESGAARDDAETWLARTGLPDPRRILAAYPHRLSGGQRQRVMIAMAMVARPRLLIADEPTTALDVTVQAQILDLVASLRSEGTGVLFVTHDLGIAAGLANRILVCHRGQIVEDGPAAQVIRAPRAAYSRALLRARFDLSTDRSRPLPTAGTAEIAPWPPVAKGKSWALELYRVVKHFPAGPRGRWGRRQPVRVLDGIDLRIAAGECVALVGESGSGKSTLLRIAAGLETADAGDVSRSGSVPPQVVFQDAVGALTPWLPIGAQIGEGLPRDTRDTCIAEALREVGLDPALAAALPSELSGGQCQRACVARALIRKPSVLLCDEPISAMDVSLAAQVLNLLNDIRRRAGLGMLFVTHDLAAARLIADRIAVLDKGRLVEEGPSEEVVTSPRAAYTEQLLAAVPRLSREGLA